MAQQMSEEQMKALQEKIKNMSPEELKEFQKKQDIFHQIVIGKVPSKKVYEDNEVLAILDIRPASAGHMLILTKEYYTIMPQLSEQEINHLATITKSLSNACLRGLDAKGTNILIQNGAAAGQRAQHFMIHLIPRNENDNIAFKLPQKTIKEDQLVKLQQELSAGLGAAMQPKGPAIQPAQQPSQAPPPSPLPSSAPPPVIEADFSEQMPPQPQPAQPSEPITIEADEVVIKADDKGKKKKEPKKQAKPAKKKDESADLDAIAKTLGLK